MTTLLSRVYCRRCTDFLDRACRKVNDLTPVEGCMKGVSLTPATRVPVPEETALELRLLSADELPHAIAAMRAHGWTLRPLAEALDRSHESIRRLEERGDPEKSKVQAPNKPVRSVPAKQVKPVVEVPEAVAKRMQELAPQASLRKGTTPPDSPIALASEEYSALLVNEYQRGVSRRGLEAATGQGWEAIRRRLSAAGAMSMPPSRHRKYPRMTAAERREREAEEAAASAKASKGAKATKSAGKKAS